MSLTLSEYKTYQDKPDYDDMTINTRTFNFQLGHLNGYVIQDAVNPHAADELIANHNIDELQMLSEVFNFDIEKIPVDYNNLLFQGEHSWVLVDAGIPRPMGKLFLGLDFLGVDPRDIGTVVITHTDMDHIGGLLDEHGQLSFPNASYVLLEDAWYHWENAEKRQNLTSLNKWSTEKMQQIWKILSEIKGQICLVKKGESFVSGLQLFPALGHRYDHSILSISSAGKKLMHVADAIVHPLFIAKPNLYSTYDADPTKAIETKVKILEICASENALLLGSHFPFPGLGYVQQKDNGWKWHSI